MFPFSFTSLQICSTNEFFNLETTTSCHYIQHITLHKNLVCLAITNLKYKDYNNFYQFLLLLSGDVILNLGPVQISPTVFILRKIDDLKCIANKTKATIIGITE